MHLFIVSALCLFSITLALQLRFGGLKTFKVGGIRFYRLGQLQLSSCVCREVKP